MAMVVGVARITVHIPHAETLKDKRQVVKSLIAQAQNQFKLSVAEVDRLDNCQFGVIGFACISNDVRHADAMLASVVRFVESRRMDAEVLDIETEIIHSI